MTDTEVRTDDLRVQLLALLEGHGARMSFDDAVAAFPAEAINAFPPNVSYTPWQLLEHLRITQWDILDYIVNPVYVELRWPDDYWPAPDATATAEQFAATIDGFRTDNEALRALVADPADRPPRGDPEHARSHGPQRGTGGRRPQRLSHRRIRDPPPGDGYLAGGSAGVGFAPRQPTFTAGSSAHGAHTHDPRMCPMALARRRRAGDTVRPPDVEGDADIGRRVLRPGGSGPSAPVPADGRPRPAADRVADRRTRPWTT